MAEPPSRIARALAHVEHRLFEPLTLDEIAASAHYSPYHFHRMFTGLLGVPVMTYVRERRLSEAADRLLTTERRLIDLAFDCGFDSQEAFTRAFERYHGTPPGRFRRRGIASSRQRGPADRTTLEHLMENVVQHPELIELPAFHVVGLAATYTQGVPNDIPDLWGRFVARMHEVHHAIQDVHYGLCMCSERVGAEGPPRFEYVASIGVERIDAVPDGMVARTVPAARYAKFTHRGDVSRIQETNAYIWGTWLPRSEYDPAPTPDFERYDDRFDGATGTGELDIYVPVSTAAPE